MPLLDGDVTTRQRVIAEHSFRRPTTFLSSTADPTPPVVLNHEAITSGTLHNNDRHTLLCTLTMTKLSLLTAVSPAPCPATQGPNSILRAATPSPGLVIFCRFHNAATRNHGCLGSWPSWLLQQERVGRLQPSNAGHCMLTTALLSSQPPARP